MRKLSQLQLAKATSPKAFRHIENPKAQTQSTGLHQQIDFTCTICAGNAVHFICMLHFDLRSVVGCFDSGQLEDVVTVTTAATYSEEVGNLL